MKGNALPKVEEKHQAALALVASYLEKKDCLLLRCVCRDLKHLLQTVFKGPHLTKTEFTIATSGFFKDKGNHHSAWVVYYMTIRSTSLGPTILYKLKDLLILTLNNSLQRFGGSDYLDFNGQKYNADKHAWNINLSWVLAQIHAKRPFVILSDIYQNSNIFHSSGKFSAFAKEIGAAYKAGYRIDSIEKVFTLDGGDHFEITLTSAQNNLHHLTMNDINPTDREIHIAINEMQKEQNQYHDKWRHKRQTLCRTMTP